MSKRSARTRRPRDPRPRRRRVDVGDPSVLGIHMVTDGPHLGGWVHTHGLAAFGLPELEMRAVSHRLLLPAAATVLCDVADYLLNGGRPVAPYDTLVLDELVCVRVHPAEPLAGQEDHYQVERWTVVDLPEGLCPFCEASSAQEDLAPRTPAVTAGNLN